MPETERTDVYAYEQISVVQEIYLCVASPSSVNSL